MKPEVIVTTKLFARTQERLEKEFTCHKLHEAADRAAETARTTFEEGALAESLPAIKVTRKVLETGLGVLNAAVHAGFVKSTGEARRQIKGGGIKVNDETVTDEKRLLTLSDLTPEGVIKLSLGKKRHVLVRAV